MEPNVRMSEGMNILCILVTIAIFVNAFYGNPPGMPYLYLMTFLAGIAYPALNLCEQFKRR